MYEQDAPSYAIRRRSVTAFLLLAIAVLAMPKAHAEKNEAPTWGNSPGLASPQPDKKGRRGHWWWPKFVGGIEVDGGFGNRGRVYGAWVRPAPEPVLVGCPGPPPPVEVPPTIICTKVVLNSILFDFDSITLKKQGMVEIDKVVAELKKFEKDTLVCVGHTDNVGTEIYNHGLGQGRAQAVVDYMVAAGIAAERLIAQSMGETEPAVRNDSRANRVLNRRVEFDITIVN